MSTKQTINIGLLGAGTVGSGVLELLQKNSSSITQKVGETIRVTRIFVRNLEKHVALREEYALTTNIDDVLNDPEIDIVVELMGGEEPARTMMLEALRHKKHVVTANKDVVAKFGRELFEAAEENQVDFLFEASVGGGIPIIRPLKQCLAANKIHEVMGIVNGTTNYMLTRMSQDDMEFAEALAEAQAKGYAEADPTADVGGLDAARKIAILSSLAFNSRMPLEKVHVEGIEKISKHDIKYAREFGYCIKLLAIAKREGDNGINARVHPVFLPLSHPLASVNDVFNAIFVRGDAVGEAMFYGRGAGKMPTASAVCADIIDVARDIVHNGASRILCTCFEETKICPIEKVSNPYYIRLLVSDQPGVLAAIAAAFAAQQVSLRTVVQKQRVGQFAELVLVTYNVPDSHMKMAIQTVAILPAVAEVCNVIRVEDPNFS